MAWLSGSILQAFPCILNASLVFMLTMTPVKAKIVVNRCEARYVKAGLCRQTREEDWKMSCANAKFLPKSYDQVCEDGTTTANQSQRVLLVITYIALRYVSSIINKQVNILSSSPRCTNVFKAKPFVAFRRSYNLKALANEDTLLRTHCCRHKCFPVCPRAQHLLRTQILCPGHKNVFDFVQKHFASATNVPQFARLKKHHGKQCVRNNVSSFTRAFSIIC